VYAIAYAVIFGAGIWYLRKLMLVGPVPQPPKDTRGGEKTAARPLSVPDEPVDAPAAQQVIPSQEARP
jgi:cytochrome d ubiquinol oxidase subunit I